MSEDSSQIVNPLTSHVGGNGRPHASANAAVTPKAQPASQAERLAWHARVVQILARVSERSSGSPNPFEPLSLLVQELTQLLGNHATAVYRYEPEGRVLRLVCGHVDGLTSAELAGHPFGRADLPLPVDDFPFWLQLTASGRPQFLAMTPESTTPPSNEWRRPVSGLPNWSKPMLL